MFQCTRGNLSKSLAGTVLLGALTAACSSGTTPASTTATSGAAALSVSPKLHVTSRTRPQFVMGSVGSLNGTYGAGCTDRSGAWSVAIDGSTADLDHAALTVVKNDTTCVLTVTAIKTDQAYIATPAIAMTDAYQTDGSAFAASLSDGGSAPLSFYANAMLSSVSFASDFVIDVVYSDDPNLVTSNASSSYASQSSTATSADVAASDYSLDLTSLAIQTDAHDVVQSAGGSADLTFNAVAGQAYAVDSSGTLPSTPTFAQIDAFYTAHTPSALSGTNPTIAASAFALGDATLPTVRTLVIARAVAGVTSYQLFRVTFHNP